MWQRGVAFGQRVEKTQPLGGFSGEGSSPLSTLCLRSAPLPRMPGVDASSARV